MGKKADANETAEETARAGKPELDASHITSRMESLVMADCVVEAVLEKFQHNLLMKEIERKLLPYVIASTTYQSTKVVETNEITYDKRVDDVFLGAAWQEVDEQEPTCLLTDQMLPKKKLRFRAPPLGPPKVSVMSQETDGGSDSQLSSS